jgi:hypothetical protein
MKDYRLKKIPLTKKNSWIFDKWAYKVEKYRPAVMEDVIVGGLFNRHIEKREVMSEMWTEFSHIFEKAKDAKEFIKILREYNNG